jgi:hypothetical protein
VRGENIEAILGGHFLVWVDTFELFGAGFECFVQLGLYFTGVVMHWNCSVEFDGAGFGDNEEVVKSTAVILFNKLFRLKK